MDYRCDICKWSITAYTWNPRAAAIRHPSRSTTFVPTNIGPVLMSKALGCADSMPYGACFQRNDCMFLFHSRFLLLALLHATPRLATSRRHKLVRKSAGLQECEPYWCKSDVRAQQWNEEDVKKFYVWPYFRSTENRKDTSSQMCNFIIDWYFFLFSFLYFFY